MIVNFGSVTLHADMPGRTATLARDPDADMGLIWDAEADAYAWLTAHGARESWVEEVDPDTALVTWEWEHDCPTDRCVECATQAVLERAVAEAQMAEASVIAEDPDDYFDGLVVTDYP